jgi:hypothetical protein
MIFFLVKPLTVDPVICLSCLPSQLLFSCLAAALAPEGALHTPSENQLQAGGRALLEVPFGPL